MTRLFKLVKCCRIKLLLCYNTMHINFDSEYDLLFKFHKILLVNVHVYVWNIYAC